MVHNQLGADSVRIGWTLRTLFLEKEEYTVTYKKKKKCPTVSLKQVLSTHKAARVYFSTVDTSDKSSERPCIQRYSGRTACCKSVDRLKWWHSSQNRMQVTVLTTLAAERNAPWRLLFDLHEPRSGLENFLKPRGFISYAGKKAEVAPRCTCEHRKKLQIKPFLSSLPVCFLS